MQYDAIRCSTMPPDDITIRVATWDAGARGGGVVLRTGHRIDTSYVDPSPFHAAPDGSNKVFHVQVPKVIVFLFFYCCSAYCSAFTFNMTIVYLLSYSFYLLKCVYFHIYLTLSPLFFPPLFRSPLPGGDPSNVPSSSTGQPLRLNNNIHCIQVPTSTSIKRSCCCL